MQYANWESDTSNLYSGEMPIKIYLKIDYFAMHTPEDYFLLKLGKSVV